MRLTLSEEVEYLKAENANLRGALALAIAPIDIVKPEWGIRGQEARIFRALAKRRGIMSIEQLYAIIYSDCLSSPDPKSLKVTICKMRPKLERFGMTIRNYKLLGYELIGYSRGADTK